MSGIQIGDEVEILHSVSSCLIGEVGEVVSTKFSGVTHWGVKFFNHKYDSREWYDSGVDYRWFREPHLRKIETVDDISESELLGIISNH